MREPKFNFVPAHQAEIKLENKNRVATIQMQSKKISFSGRDPEAIAMVGKYLQFYVDKEKNVLGWKVFNKGEMSDLKNLSQVCRYDTKSSGVLISVSATLPLKNLKITERSYKRLPIEMYKSTELLSDKKPYYYITIPKAVKKL